MDRRLPDVHDPETVQGRGKTLSQRVRRCVPVQLIHLEWLGKAKTVKVSRHKERQ